MPALNQSSRTIQSIIPVAMGLGPVNRHESNGHASCRRVLQATYNTLGRAASGQASENGLTISIPAIFCPAFRSSVSSRSAPLCSAAARIIASQNEICQTSPISEARAIVCCRDGRFDPDRVIAHHLTSGAGGKRRTDLASHVHVELLQHLVLTALFPISRVPSAGLRLSAVSSRRPRREPVVRPD